MQAEEGDYVLIRAKVARWNQDMALVEIEYARDNGKPTPFTLVVERASIVAVELRKKSETVFPMPAEWRVTFAPEAMREAKVQQLCDLTASCAWFRSSKLSEPITMTVQVAYDNGMFEELFGSDWPTYSVSSV